MSAYALGYIEQLARPFTLRKALSEERTRARRGPRGEQAARHAVSQARDARQLADTQTAQR